MLVDKGCYITQRHLQTSKAALDHHQIQDDVAVNEALAVALPVQVVTKGLIGVKRHCLLDCPIESTYVGEQLILSVGRNQFQRGEKAAQIGGRVFKRSGLELTLRDICAG